MREVFKQPAHRVVKGMMYDARVKAVVVFHKCQGQYMDRERAKRIHLTSEEYAHSEVDWLSQHADAWAWMCVYWASDDFKNLSIEKRGNQCSKPGRHRFGADGHTGKATRMVCYFVHYINLIIS